MPPAGPEPQSPPPVAATSTSAVDEGTQEHLLGSRSALAFSSQPTPSGIHLWPRNLGLLPRETTHRMKPWGSQQEGAEGLGDQTLGKGTLERVLGSMVLL